MEKCWERRNYEVLKVNVDLMEKSEEETESSYGYEYYLEGSNLVAEEGEEDEDFMEVKRGADVQNLSKHDHTEGYVPMEGILKPYNSVRKYVKKSI